MVLCFRNWLFTGWIMNTMIFVLYVFKLFNTSVPWLYLSGCVVTATNTFLVRTFRKTLLQKYHKSKLMQWTRIGTCQKCNITLHQSKLQLWIRKTLFQYGLLVREVKQKLGRIQKINNNFIFREFLIGLIQPIIDTFFALLFIQVW